MTERQTIERLKFLREKTKLKDKLTEVEINKLRDRKRRWMSLW